MGALRNLLPFVAAVAAAYGVLCLRVFFTQRAQIYFPTRVSAAPGAQALWVESQGARLKVWVIERAGPRALLSVASVVWAVNSLEFKTDRNGLIGTDSEYSRLLHEYQDEFRSAEDYVIMVEGDDPKQNRATVDLLRNALVAVENNPHPDDDNHAQQFAALDVFDRVNLSAIEPWSLYYLDETGLAAIGVSLQDFRQLVSLLQAEPTLASFFDAMDQMLQQMESASPVERARMTAFLPTVSALTSISITNGVLCQ